MKQAQETMQRIGLGLIEERRHDVATELENSKAKSKDGSTAIDGDKTILGRDILSVLSTPLLPAYSAPSKETDIENN